VHVLGSSYEAEINNSTSHFQDWQYLNQGVGDGSCKGGDSLRGGRCCDGLHECLGLHAAACSSGGATTCPGRCWDSPREGLGVGATHRSLQLRRRDDLRGGAAAADCVGAWGYTPQPAVVGATTYAATRGRCCGGLGRGATQDNLRQRARRKCGCGAKGKAALVVL
jgi:hypothetical protein